MSHKGRNSDPGRTSLEPAVTHRKPTALMEAQREALKRNRESELIKAGVNDFSQGLTPHSSRNSILGL